MSSDTRPTDHELDARLRTAFATMMPLLDDVESHRGISGPTRASVKSSEEPLVFDLAAPRPTRRRPLAAMVASAAAVALVVAGLATLQRDTPPPNATDAPTAPTTTAPGDLISEDRLRDPASTVFGALVESKLPEGYELVYASDGPEPLVVALSPDGGRFEAIVYSSAQRRAEVDRISDDLELEVPEGLLAVGPDGELDERSAYLVTDTAIIRTDFVRVGDASTIEPTAAADVARGIAQDLPSSLATGQPVAIGTEFFNDAVGVVEALADRVDDSGGTIRSAGAPTVEVMGDFRSIGGPDNTTVRVEMFDGFVTPEFLANDIGDVGQDARAGSWLLIVTVDGAPTSGPAVSAVRDAVAQIVPPPTDSPDVPISTPVPGPTTTLPVEESGLTLLTLDPPPDGYELERASYRPGVGGTGVATYTSADTSTELDVIVRNGPLPVETLESLDRTTWEVDGLTIWSDGEMDTCLPDHCSIGVQWDDETYVSLQWAEPQSGDLAPGSSQETLLDLLPDLVESDAGWRRLDDTDTFADSAASVDEVPIVSGEVLVANANEIGGSAGRLSELLRTSGFEVREAVNSSLVNRDETTIYVSSGAECLGIQIASSIGGATIETMPEIIPVPDIESPTDPDVLVELGNDVAARLTDDDVALDLGPPGELVVVDGTDDTSVVDAFVAELTASGVPVTDIVQADREVVDTMFVPIGEPTPWTCGAAASIGIDGFDGWSPDLIDGDLPDGTDAVLVVGL